MCVSEESSIRSGMETVWTPPELAKGLGLYRDDAGQLFAILESGERVEAWPIYQKLNFGQLD